MGQRISAKQREDVRRLLAEGHDRNTIANTVGVTPGQVSAVAAHIKMGTYDLPKDKKYDGSQHQFNCVVERMHGDNCASVTNKEITPIILGNDVETKDLVYWNPDPISGIANPHVLILGESGSGKTYAISCLVAELSRQGVVSVVFDYGQGFTSESYPVGFTDLVHPVEIQAAQDGVNVNPLQIFPTDSQGPINVAQRIADTFARVYPKIGVQQHSVLRQAVLETLGDAGILAEKPNTWTATLPMFRAVHDKLNDYAMRSGSPQSKYAGAVASHISTLFFFNTLRSDGQRLAWREMLAKAGAVYVIQLKGLEQSLEKVLTEFLLWNFIGFIESLGPGPLRCFVVLDEAHKLAFGSGTPADKLLREGRKFGLAAILASQQPDDFNSIAFSNTATKMIFHTSDTNGTISRFLAQKMRPALPFQQLSRIINTLVRGCALLVSHDVGCVVKINSMDSRLGNHS